MLNPELHKFIVNLYLEGKNVTSALIAAGTPINFDVVELLYDLQAGTYTNDARNNPQLIDSFVDEICDLSDSILRQTSSILDCGTGEGNTLVPILDKYRNIKRTFAIDSSWSRLSWAKENLNEASIIDFSLAVADLKSIPMKDGYVDMVIAIHAIEPNGGAEQIILSEMARVTSRYMILVEPDFLNASLQQKERMKSLNFIGDLREFFDSAGLKLLDCRTMKNFYNPLNQASVFLLEKREVTAPKVLKNELPWVDPKFKGEGKIFESGIRFDSGFWHPSLSNIPFLRVSDGKLTSNPFVRNS